jgi:hypothetical protein
MSTTSLFENPPTSDHEQPQAAAEETHRIEDTVRTCLQTSLAGEAQNFRSWVAATHRKFNSLQKVGLATTAMTCLLSCGMLLASVWQARHVTSQAEAQLQYLQKQAPGPDAFADLRRQNWEPMGKLITQKGRTFIELKVAK